jgi:hypothetical protein
VFDLVSFLSSFGLLSVWNDLEEETSNGSDRGGSYGEMILCLLLEVIDVSLS